MAESEARRLGVGISSADLSRDIVHSAWGGRFLEYADVLADDFVWIGALPVQYRLSKEETLKVYGGGSWTIPNISFANDPPKKTFVLLNGHCHSPTPPYPNTRFRSSHKTAFNDSINTH